MTLLIIGILILILAVAAGNAKKPIINNANKKPLLSPKVNIQQQDQIINEMYKVSANPISLKPKDHINEVGNKNQNTVDDLIKDLSTKSPETNAEGNKESNKVDLNKEKGIVANLLSVINPGKTKSNTNQHIVADLLKILTEKPANDSNTYHSIKSTEPNDDGNKESKNDDLNQEQGIVASLLGTINPDKTKSNEVPPEVPTNAVLKVGVLDDSIIDITGQSQKIDLPVLSNNLSIYEKEVPFWNHQYIFSEKDINGATNLQKEFYNFFKYRFLKGQYLDLNGNNNYAFILLFDLLKNYETHKNILLLEQQLKEIGQYYPKTKSYAKSFLIKKFESLGDYDSITKVRTLTADLLQDKQLNHTRYFDDSSWLLGTRFKIRLKLREEEVKVLNNIQYSSNNFCSIDHCMVEVIRLYLSTIEEIKSKSMLDGKTLDNLIIDVCDVILQKHFKYKKGSNNHIYGFEPVKREIYSNIFRRCENAVRECYGHKRKINTDTYYTNPDAKLELESKVINPVNEILMRLVSIINPPDEATEIELNLQNTSRWKLKFNELSANYKNGDAKVFCDSILTLGSLNKKNPSVENIFYEASKFIAKTDKETSLRLYIYYLDYDLKSETFDNKQFTKTIQKSLFKNNEQLHDFQIIVSELFADKNLDKALEAVSKLYLPKRKKINLDTKSILEVQQLHSGTVELLNEYLKDEYEDDNNMIKTQEINKDELKIEITHKDQIIQNSVYIADIPFTPIQTDTLDFCAKCNFAIEHAELESFAKSKGSFINHLVESINEACYEKLDDLLIEEEDEFYIINQDYYKRLLK